MEVLRISMPIRHRLFTPMRDKQRGAVLTVDSPEPLAKPSGPRYQPIAQIGRGGMAEVLLAMMDAGCGARRLVVLKRIWPELATDPDFMTMFLDEARLSVRMNHPNVVRTYEVLAHGATQPQALAEGFQRGLYVAAGIALLNLVVGAIRAPSITPDEAIVAEAMAG